MLPVSNDLFASDEYFFILILVYIYFLVLAYIQLSVNRYYMNIWL